MSIATWNYTVRSIGMFIVHYYSSNYVNFSSWNSRLNLSVPMRMLVQIQQGLCAVDKQWFPLSKQLLCYLECISHRNYNHRVCHSSTWAQALGCWWAHSDKWKETWLEKTACITLIVHGMRHLAAGYCTKFSGSDNNTDFDMSLSDSVDSDKSS